MKPPARLFADPAAPVEVRADLARVKRAGSRYDEAAGLLQLRAALSDAAAAPQPGAAGGSWLSRVPWGWKLALIGAIGGGSAWLASPHRASTRTASVQPVPAALAQPAPPTAAELAPPTAAVPPAAAELAPPTAADSANLSEPAAKPEAARSSRREIEQLIRLRALLASDPAAAYRLAQRSQREFPRGALREERDALLVLALDALGDHERARSESRAFLRRYPESPLRARLERLAAP